mgnify:CR=1 FL=1
MYARYSVGRYWVIYSNHGYWNRCQRKWAANAWPCLYLQYSTSIDQTHVLEYLLVLCFVLMPPSFDYQIWKQVNFQYYLSGFTLSDLIWYKKKFIKSWKDWWYTQSVTRKSFCECVECPALNKYCNQYQSSQAMHHFRNVITLIMST